MSLQKRFFSLNYREPFERFEPFLFVAFAWLATLVSARYFYGSLLAQTEGQWIAPLDDVFIHFDYARSIARGHPFEWSEGNGYSSGATSILYPFVLSLGYLAGFRGLSLMPFAASLACASVFATLLLVRHVVRECKLPCLTSYVFPLAMFGMGALAWSLWSGMEVAFFLFTWSLALVAFVRARRAVEAETDGMSSRKPTLLLGAACVLMDLVRPEALVIALVLACSLAIGTRSNLRRAVVIIFRVVGPVVLLVLFYASLNAICTGEAAASGAIVKLIPYKPYLDFAEKLSDYRECLRLATAFTLMYHMSGEPNFGLAFLALALAPLLFRSTRSAAMFLWAHVIAWVLFIAQNEQLRWQNQRYVMPAAAWFMLLVALGVSALVGRVRPNVWACLAFAGLFTWAAKRLFETPPPASWFLILLVVLVVCALLRFRAARAVGGVALVLACGYATEPRLREQRWFFGRAARNIRDQQVSLGAWIATQKPKRVLLGDAGAIPYLADVPALDAIGLGGYKKLPFARAKLQGVGATLELLEHVEPEDRPDMMAIFPSWWDVMPMWFGRELKRFPAEGNVICGDYEHVAYSADFSALGTGMTSRSETARRGILLDELDLADLVSERFHAFEMDSASATEPRILPDPLDPARDLFDVGRRIEQGKKERFVLRTGPSRGTHKKLSLVMRVISDGDMRARVSVDGHLLVERRYPPSKGWEEDVIELPVLNDPSRVPIEIESVGFDDFTYFHAWLVRAP